MLHPRLRDTMGHSACIASPATTMILKKLAYQSTNPDKPQSNQIEHRPFSQRLASRNSLAATTKCTSKEYRVGEAIRKRAGGTSPTEGFDTRVLTHVSTVTKADGRPTNEQGYLCGCYRSISHDIAATSGGIQYTAEGRPLFYTPTVVRSFSVCASFCGVARELALQRGGLYSLFCSGKNQYRYL